MPASRPARCPSSRMLGLVLLLASSLALALGACGGGGGGSSTSTPVITITVQPTALTAQAGGATFSVLASVTPAGTLAYQWEKQEAGTTVWTAVATGGTSALLALTGLVHATDDGDSYRVVVSATGAASVTSAECLLTVPTWAQLGLDIDGESAGDQSGWTTSLSDDGLVVAIGAPENDAVNPSAGHVRVWAFDTGTATWVQRGADIDGTGLTAGAGFGFSVALSANGQVLVAGAPGADTPGNSQGLARVYAWNGTAWVQRGSDLAGDATGDRFGTQVSISDDGAVVAVGAIYNQDGGSNAGRVRVYAWDGSNHVQRGVGFAGNAFEEVGWSSSLNSDGTVLAYGAKRSTAGHAVVYVWDGVTWIQRGGSAIVGEAAGDQSGAAVSLSSDGTMLAIAAPGNDATGTRSGQVRVYTWNGTAWFQVGADLDGEAAGDADLDEMSVSLSNNGTAVAIGWPENDGGGTSAGTVRVYDWDGTAWVLRFADLDGEAADDRSGGAVSISGDGRTVARGAIQNDNSGGTNAGHVRVCQTTP